MSHEAIKSIESFDQFKKRVEQVTGVAFDVIPESDNPLGADSDYGTAVCENAEWSIFRHPESDRLDSAGTEIWDPEPRNYWKIKKGK